MDELANLIWTQAACRRGLSLGADEAFHFIPAPAVGGSFDPSKIAVASIAAVLSLAGQLHRQLRRGSHDQS